MRTKKPALSATNVKSSVADMGTIKRSLRPKTLSRANDASIEQKSAEMRTTRLRQKVSAKKHSVNISNADIIHQTRNHSGAKKKNVNGNVSQLNKKNLVVKQKNSTTIKSSKKNMDNNIKNSKQVSNRSSRQHQLSLKESFCNQTALKLRPRQNKKVHCDDTKMLETHIDRNKQNSIVLAYKCDGTANAKKPVYKRNSIINESAENESDVYKFQYDINDSQERIPRKRKKRAVKNKTSKNTKTAVHQKLNKKDYIPPKKVIPDIQVTCVDTKRPAVVTKEEHNIVPSVKEKFNESILEPTEQLIRGDTVFIPETLSEKVTANGENKVNERTKPIIRHVESLDNTKVTILPSSTNTTPNTNFRPFRPTDVFENKSLLQQKMMHHSLLNKSLSPILKSPNRFDPGSPWRPPTLNTFSRVKDMFQSTPQWKRARHMQDSRNLSEVPMTKKGLENINENVNVQQLPNKNVQKEKRSQEISRRFGTEITNVDQSVQPNANVTHDEKNRSTITEPESPSRNNRLKSGSLNCPPLYDIVEDKENAVPTHGSPKKSMKKTKRNTAPETKVLQNPINVKPTLDYDNFDAQPGPSGLQKVTFSEKENTLRQSNLNNFLNLTEKPESSRISTSYGIFDDAHSTPVNGKPLKKIQRSIPTAENAFGFSESDSELDISPINAEIKQQKVQHMQSGRPEILKSDLETPLAPLRLPEKRIKDQLTNATPVQTENEENRAMKDNAKTDENANNKEKNKIVTDIINFSDTFDILSETGDLPKDLPDVPLFADVEPVHFREPARRSYKRKREVRFNLSDESSGDDEDKRPEIKKKKATKLNKLEEKRLQEWVENVNQTFYEIDQYDLVIE